MNRQESHFEEVRKYLEQGKAISPLLALKKFGCFRLSDVIYRLRKKLKMNITTTLVSDNGKVYAQYKEDKPKP